MTRTITGFIVPDLVATKVIGTIDAAYGGSPVWLPEIVALGSGQSMVCASKALMETLIRSDEKLGDIPLANALISQLGGWEALQTREIEINTTIP